MLICDLIEDLRRFPQGARLTFTDGQILVDASPYEKDGTTVFDVRCGDDELPDELRGATERYKAT
jgi:hypothetical protein